MIPGIGIKTKPNVISNPDGKYCVAITTGNDYIYVSNDYGNTWEAKGVQARYSDIDISASGQYITAVIGLGFAGYIYVSADYGNTWTQKSTNTNRNLIRMSHNGQYQYASNNRSTDYGNTWVSAPQYSYNEYGIEIDMSASGQYIIIVNAENVYLSNNYGASFTSYTYSYDEFYLHLNSAIMSASGQYTHTLADYYYYPIDDIYGQGYNMYSSNYSIPININHGTYGENRMGKSTYLGDFYIYFNADNRTWYKVPNYGAGNIIFITNENRLDMNPTGQYMVSYDNHYGIFVSSNGGASFTNKSNINITFNTGDYDLSNISYSGKTMLICQYLLNSQIIVSNDFGNNWGYKGVSKIWRKAITNKFY